MSDEILKRDDNRVTVGAGVTDDSNAEIRMFRIDAVSKRLKVDAEFPGNTDGRIKVSSDDTTFNYLESKLVAGSGVTLTVNNPGGNETITVSAAGTSFYTTMQDGGTPLTQRTNLNFVNFFTLADDAGNDATTVDINVTELGGDSTFISTLETNLDLGNISGVIDLSTQVTGLLDVSNIDVTALANDTTFVNALSANSTFVTALSNNTTFTSALDLGDIGGLLDLSTQVTGVLDSDNINVTDLAANATFISAMETALDLANISGQIDLTSQVSGILPLANGGTGAALVDPNDDRIYFWDDSAGTTAFLDIGTGLSITGTTLNATGSSDKYVGVGGTDTKTYFNFQAENFKSLDDSANPLWQSTGTVTVGLYASDMSTGSNLRMTTDSLGLPDPTSSADVSLGFDANKEAIVDTFVRVDSTGNTSGFFGFNILGANTAVTLANNTLSVGFLIDGSDWYVRSSNGTTTTNTAITTPTTGMRNFRIEYDPADTEARFYIDGTLVGTITTNLPTASTSSIGFIYKQETSGGTQTFDKVLLPSFAVAI